MPLNFSAAHSSRISKRPNSRNPLMRHSSSPFNGLRQRKPTRSSTTAKEDEDEDDGFLEDPLEEKCLVTCLTTDLSLRDVPQSIQYTHSHMFDPIPERGGMNSSRIAEILNFRKSLPPTVTLAHLHALIGSPTNTEREIAELTNAGIIRKILIPGRGTGALSISEGLVLVHDLEKLLEDVDGLDQATKGKRIDSIWSCFFFDHEPFRQFSEMPQDLSFGVKDTPRSFDRSGMYCADACGIFDFCFSGIEFSECIRPTWCPIFRNHDVSLQDFSSGIWLCGSGWRRWCNPWCREYWKRRPDTQQL